MAAVELGDGWLGAVELGEGFVRALRLLLIVLRLLESRETKYF